MHKRLMKKTYYTLFFALSAFFYILTGCKKEEPAVPVADRIKNSYVASSVQEGTTTVYTAGGTSNIEAGLFAVQAQTCQTHRQLSTQLQMEPFLQAPIH